MSSAVSVSHYLLFDWRQNAKRGNYSAGLSDCSQSSASTAIYYYYWLCPIFSSSSRRLSARSSLRCTKFFPRSGVLASLLSCVETASPLCQLKQPLCPSSFWRRGFSFACRCWSEWPSASVWPFLALTSSFRARECIPRRLLFRLLSNDHSNNLHSDPWTHYCSWDSTPREPRWELKGVLAWCLKALQSDLSATLIFFVY